MNQGIYALTQPDGRDPSRPYATPAQARAQTSAASVISPAMFQEAQFAWVMWDVGATSLGSVTANGGSVSAFGSVVSVGVSTTANSTAIWKTNNDLNGWNVGTSYSSNGSVDWSRPRAFAVRVLATGSFSTNQVFRCLWGKDQSAGVAQLSAHGIGFEVRNRRFWLVAHNGAALTSVDGGQDFSTGYAATYDVAITSDGAGNVAMFLNGTQIASTSSGPTAVNTSITQCFALELTNGGDATAQTFRMLRFVKFLNGR